ncbi:MAG: amidohydrolase [candidate division FCPU426 bacterium]
MDRSAAGQARKLLPRLRAWRREIHRQPELAFRERRTASFLARVLRSAGWQVRTGVARTGVVALLRGRRPGPVLALRADMDALPICEATGAPYASRVPGVMHACGHDGNQAMLLGAAQILAGRREQLAGSVKLIFQPSEEVPPGGAQAMIAAGVLEHPRVDLILAGHVDTQLPAGTIGVREGAAMAAADAFVLTVTGRGGHAALPHCSVDAIAAAAAVITGLQQAVAREQDPLEPAVVSVGRIRGGEAYNAIAGEAVLEGTLRSLSAATRRSLAQRVARISRNICRAHRAEARFSLQPGHPPLVNHPRAAGLVRRAGLAVLGRGGVREWARPLMTGEDFTYFARRRPACFFRVGVGGSAARFRYPWHHPRFDFDERGLASGAAVLAQAALDFLGGRA